MSSTGQPPSPFENLILIINALADYSKETGVDLSKNAFAVKLERLTSPEDILQLLEEREKAFKDYRNGNRRLTNFFKPVVKVLHGFSGILSNTASLIPFPPATILFAGVDTLLGAACEVSSSYDALLDLFEHLGSFLGRLDIYTKIQLTPIMTGIIVKIMAQLLSVLALATKQIKEKRFKKFAKKLLGEKEIEEVLQRMNQLTQEEAQTAVAETLGLVHGLVGNVRLIMEDREASMDSIRRDSAALQQVLSKINKMNDGRLQRDVQHWLSPPDPSTNHISVSKLRHNGTAAWIFESEELKKWITKGSILWIHGKPGAGKSTLLSVIIEDIKGKRAIEEAKIVYYYFDFRIPEKQKCYGLLSSLVLQLSVDSEPRSNILSKLYTGVGPVLKPTLLALKTCIMDMLSQPGQGPIYIIVDGVDECQNSSGMPSDRQEVLDLIKELVDLKLPSVYVCVASRPEIDIRMVLGSLEPLQINLDDEIGQKADIIAYIKSLVNSNRVRVLGWTEEDQNLVINTLSQKANCMFRYVACQSDNVLRCYSDDIQGVLDDLPKDLNETYERILRDIDDHKRKYAHRLLQSLLVSIRPLRVEELAAMFSVQLDTTAPTSSKKHPLPLDAEGLVFSTCSSLITMINQGGSQVVQFAHFSVKEFLTSERLANAEERLSFYHILPEPSHTFLAHASLSVLLQLDDRIDRDSIADLPLAPYAAQHWVVHAQFGNASLHIGEVMKRLFDPVKSHFAAWVWLYDIDRYWTERMPTTHPMQPEAVPLYYASLCGFVGLTEHLLAAHSPNVNAKGGFHTTALHAASVKGHLQVASLLLRNGADPNSRDHLGRVPLHKLSQGGQLVIANSSLEIGRLLINCGADVNATDDEGSAPLHAAAHVGYREIAELLLGSNAILDARNKEQQTPLGVSCSNGKRDMAQFLIDRGSDINSRDEIGFIPLHAASRWGHVDVTRLLLDCGSDVDARGTENWTPLHYASRYGYPDLARLLLDHSADVNAQQLDCWTALHDASSCGHLDIAKLLIDRGAIVDNRNDKQQTSLVLASSFGHLEVASFLIKKGAAVSALDEEGKTPFHWAASQGHLSVTKFLLECGIDLDIRDGNGRTPFYWASHDGKLDVVRFLIEEGVNIHIGDMVNSTPLHAASLNGHLDVVQLLVNSGTPVDVRDGTQKTPLALASSKSKVEVARFLIHRGADLNVRDNQNQALLHLVSQHGHLEMARLLLDHGVDPNVKGNDLCSPLHLASASGHLKIAELLVQRGASVDISNDKQETPIHQAVANKNTAIVRLLIDHGATVHAVDSNGWTVLHAASRYGHLGVVKLLLRQGANVDAVNKAGRSVAELASENGQTEVAKFIAEYKADANIRNKLRSMTLDTVQYGADDDWKDETKVSLHAAAEEGNIDTVKSLLERGVDINACNASNQTPLDRAAEKGNIDVVRLLIERGAEVDSRDNWGWTPLHYSLQFRHPRVSQVLLDHGANMNARTRNYWTPMHLSASHGYLEIVKLLLERGADIHAINRDGETPYQISLRSGKREIADLLRKHGAGKLQESAW